MKTRALTVTLGAGQKGWLTLQFFSYIFVKVASNLNFPKRIYKITYVL